jgi:hypothetical protein
MTRKELSERYGFCDRTIRKLLREAGVTHRKLLLEKDLEAFIRHVGKPEKPSIFDRI